MEAEREVYPWTSVSSVLLVRSFLANCNHKHQPHSHTVLPHTSIIYAYGYNWFTPCCKLPRVLFT